MAEAISPVYKRPKDDQSSNPFREQLASNKDDTLKKQTDFPEEETMKEIKQEIARWTSFTRILVLGQPKSGKSSVINALLSSSHEQMTVSQYDLDFSVINEHIEERYKHLAAKKFKYFTFFTEEIEDWCRDHNVTGFGSVHGDGDEDNDGSPFVMDRKSQKLEQELTEHARSIFGKLAEYTNESLESALSRRAVIRNSNLLFPGFMRQILEKEDMQIPSEIVVLIDAFYVPNKLLINSFKLRWGRGTEGMFLDLWESNGVDKSYWIEQTHSRGAVIFVIDLSTYDEYFVDENGQKKNKLEYAHSVWTSWKESETQILTLLTKKDLFQQKIKEKPLNICPLFSGIDQQLDRLSLCLTHIRGKFEFMGYPYVVNTSEVKDIRRYFQTLLAKKAKKDRLNYLK